MTKQEEITELTALFIKELGDIGYRDECKLFATIAIEGAHRASKCFNVDHQCVKDDFRAYHGSYCKIRDYDTCDCGLDSLLIKCKIC